MKVIRKDRETHRPLLDSLPVGTMFHLGIDEHATWLICQERGSVKMAACLETGALRVLSDMADNVSRLYHEAVVS